VIFASLLAASAAATIPASFTGEWAVARFGCKTGQLHSHLHIGAHSMSDGEFEAHLIKAHVLAPRIVKITAAWLAAEGTDVELETLTLSRDGLSLTTQSRGKRHHWTRCK
jgi:hypothetical protein